jgi:hypothetical protein
MKISKGEKALRKTGIFLPIPMNLYILLTSTENDMLSMIRHYQSFGQRYISDSLIRLCTGRNKKAIKRAKDSLADMGIIKILGITKKGTEYDIDYEKLCPIVRKLNEERNAVKRLKLADEFRGEGNALHSQLREEYKDTNFDNIL